MKKVLQVWFIVVSLYQQTKGITLKLSKMTTQDLTNNRDRIIRKIKVQITRATRENIKDVMVKMVAMLPQFAGEKATMCNIDKLTMKATLCYIKYDIVFTSSQNSALDIKIEQNRKDSLQSSLR